MARPLAALIALATALPCAAAPADAEIALLDRLAVRATNELQENILPFWITHVRHPKRGGFYGEIRADLSANERAPRGALLTCRVLWTYSAQFRRDPRNEYRDMARWAYEDLLSNFWDAEYGGFYWTIHPDGAPLARHKQIYLHTFGIYALSEYHRATGDEVALQRAREVFRLMEDQARDKAHGGYLEAFNREWTREIPQMRRVIGGTAPKSQNTHLHVMEAYSNLLHVWSDDELRAAQTTLLGLMLDRILDPKTHHLGLYFDADWTPASSAISYGHDIEAAWLLCEAAETLGDAELVERTRRAAVDIARVTLSEGISPLGGVANEGGPSGITNADHEWWPQAEAAVGFLNAYQISGDPAFLRAAESSWSFIEKFVVDHKRGEWFLMVDSKGKPQPDRPKASLWKCPYHNGRACMELADRVAALRAH